MDLAPLFTRFQQKDRHALARLLTLVARGEQVQAIRDFLSSQARSASEVIAITGSAGVGKSTLIGKLIELLRSKEKSVAVLACDPQSPLTGGALLGDRFRMPNRPDDPGVFIRSLATASGHGSIAEHLDVMIDLLKAFSFDYVLLETVGAGQGDTAVRDLADAVVLLLQPEAGDDIQWEKAGLLEVADLVVIHKGDLPGADRVEAQVRSLLNLPGCREVPVLRVSAVKESGLEELYQLLESLPAHRPEASPNSSALLRLAQQRLAERFQQQHGEIEAIQERWRRQELDDRRAAEEVLRLLTEQNPQGSGRHVE